MQKRIVEIDGLFQKLYEDNATGKITGKRCEMLSAAYEKELKEYLTTVSEKSAGLEQFIAKVKRITRPTERTPGKSPCPRHGILTTSAFRSWIFTTRALA